MSELLQVLVLIAALTALLLTFRYLTARADRESKANKRRRHRRRASSSDPENRPAA